MGFPLSLKKILQYRFGIDANEFLSKSTIEEVNIAGMNTKAVVHHREMMDTPGLKTIDRQHHVCGIQRMNEVSDDAIRLLPRVDLPCFILLINNERAIRRRDAQGLRFPGLMNNTETSRCCPRHASIHLRQSASHVTKPVHDVARLNGDFGNAFLQDFRQIPGAFLRIFAVLCGLFLDEFPVTRPTRYPIWSRHRCMLDDGTIDLSEQLPGWISIVLSGIFRVSRYTPADVICDFLVNILRLISRNQVSGASADRIAAHGTQMLVSVTGAIHTHRQMRPKIGTFLSIGFRVVHETREPKTLRITTSDRTFVVYQEDETRKIDSRKQADGIVAHLVHSLDAAHMMLTVNRLQTGGVHHFAMVHDSFGVHASDIDFLNRALREEFVRIYSEPVLQNFLKEQREAHPEVDLPELPQTGNLDIRQVISSSYFFA